MAGPDTYAPVACRDVIQELNLPRVRLSVQHLSDKEHRVVLVELDEFHKWVIGCCGQFFLDGLAACVVGVGGWVMGFAVS